jgi:peptidoglycan/xylan/chitin deacetylase (PgdA/CDA1 family)
MPYALTFDDGPGPSTESLLDVLAQAGVKATFFILGRNVEQPPWTNPANDREAARKIVRRALREGHTVANHTMSHPPSTLPAPFMQEVKEMDELIKTLRRSSDVPSDFAIPVRLPYGEQAHDPRAREMDLRRREHVGWTSAFGDWLDRSAEDIAADMCAHVEEFESIGLRSVLLLHDGSESAPYERRRTVEAVRQFLVVAKSSGWDGVRL